MAILYWPFTMFSEDRASLSIEGFGDLTLRLLLTLVGKLNWFEDKTCMEDGAESFESLPWSVEVSS